MIPEAIASALRQDRDRLDDERKGRNKRWFEALINRKREVLVAVSKDCSTSGSRIG